MYSASSVTQHWYFESHLVSIKVFSLYNRKTGISEAFEGHMGPITGIDCHNVPGQIDFSPYFLTSSFDWTLKLWSIKVRQDTVSRIIPFKQIGKNITIGSRTPHMTVEWDV